MENSDSTEFETELNIGDDLSILDFLDISIIDLVSAAIIFIGSIILFFTLRKIYKTKNIVALKYFYIGIGVYLIMIIAPLIIWLVTFIFPFLFDKYEGYIVEYGSIFTYAANSIGSFFILVGALKLRKYANAL